MAGRQVRPPFSTWFRDHSQLRRGIFPGDRFDTSSEVWTNLYWNDNSYFNVAAVIAKPDRPGSFDVSATIVDHRFGADAYIKFPILTGRPVASALVLSADQLVPSSRSFATSAVVWNEFFWTSYIIAKTIEFSPGLSVDAVLFKSPIRELAAAAWIRYPPIEASWTADAVVSITSSRSLTAASILRRTTSTSLAVNAIVRYPDTPGSFVASAFAKNAFVDSLTADAIVASQYSGSFAASAVILKSIFRDDFNRTVAKGLGGEWSWHRYDSSVSSSEDQFSSVDGSALNILSPYVGNSVYDSHVGFPLPATGDLAFDFLVPATFDSDYLPTYGFALDTNNYRGPFVRANTATEWLLFAFGNNGSSYSFSPNPSTWYRVHVRWTDSWTYARLWKVADPEPATWNYEAPNNWVFAVNNVPPVLDLYYSPRGPVVGKLDNIEFWSSQSQWTKYGGFQIGAVFDTPTKLGSFSAAAVIFKTIFRSVTADARIYNGHEVLEFTANAVFSDGRVYQNFPAAAWIIRYVPPIPPTNTISFKINGVDITDDVVIEDAEFNSMASGAQPGTCSFRLKDKEHTYAFVVGQTLTLEINGKPIWGGWVQNISRQFFFPYTGSVHLGSTLSEGVIVPCIGVATEMPRAWKIEGIDYNILFRKRFASNKADRADMELKSWPVGTHDDVQIHYLCENHLDLEDDGINTTSMVEYVGTPNPDTAGNAYGASWSWEAAMGNIADYPGAIYYIDSEKRLVYTDVDTVSSDYWLSDVPLPGTLGYRDMEIIYNGSQLVNDALVWGVGQGSDKTQFKRVRDDASITAHGLWQQGDFRSDMYRQASVDKRASGFVYGSPQNKRGGKDDAVSIIVTVFEPVFLAGQKVDFTSNVFGFSDVIPIRQMKTTFPTNGDPQFDLTLSHNIDQPWNTSEFLFPKFHFNVPKIIIPPPTLPTDRCPTPNTGRMFEDANGNVTSLDMGWLPVFTDDFTRPNGTQPNDSKFGYWGDVAGAPIGYMVFNNGWDVPFGKTYLWLASTLSADIEVIVKAHLGLDYFLLTFGRMFSLKSGSGIWIDLADGAYEAYTNTTIPTGDVFIRYVEYKDFYSAIKIWPQSDDEPFNWTFTSESSLGSRFTIPIHGSGVTIKAFTIFTTPNQTPRDAGMSSYGDGPGTVLWDYNCGRKVHFPGQPFDTGIIFAPQPGPYSSVPPSYPSQISYSATVGWPYAPLYPGIAGDIYDIEANQVILPAAIPDAVTLPSVIRVLGTISAHAQYSWGAGATVDGDRVHMNLPMTIDVDVYDYPCGSEPFATPPFVLGRTIGSVLLVPYTNDWWLNWDSPGSAPDPTIDFVFDVPADMLVNINLTHRLQIGIKVHNPYDALHVLDHHGGPFMFANTASLLAKLTDVKFQMAFPQGANGGYFCVPASDLGGTYSQRVCESLALDPAVGLTLEVMPPGSYDVPDSFVREITLKAPYVPRSVEVSGDGRAARPGLDFVETDFSTGKITFLNDFLDVRLVTICYFPLIVVGTPDLGSGLGPGSK